MLMNPAGMETSAFWHLRKPVCVEVYRDILYTENIIFLIFSSIKIIILRIKKKPST